MKKRIVTLALAMALVPALAMAQKTSYDYDKTTDFTGFKTYALKDGTKVGQPLIDDRIVTAIEAEAGQVVAAGQTVARLARPGGKEVVIAVPESQRERVERATDYRVTLNAVPGKSWQGRLRELSPVWEMRKAGIDPALAWKAPGNP